MRKLLALSLWLLAVSCWVACSEKLSPEEQAAKAALSYYNRILEGYPDGLEAAKFDDDSLPDDYRHQMMKIFKHYTNDLQQKHGGLKAVSLSNNAARRDSLRQSDGTWQYVTYAFLILAFNDSTQEEIAVPMVERNGEWFLK